MKAGTQDHVKFRTLKTLLKVPRVVASGILTELWSLAATSADSGDIGRYSNLQIAASMEWEGDPDELIDALVQSGWVDEDEEHRLVVHDWYEHAPDYIKKRINRKQNKLQKIAPNEKPSASGGQRQTTADNGGQRQKTADSVPENEQNGALTHSIQGKSIQGKSDSAQPDGSGSSPDSKIPNVEKLDELISAFEMLPSGVGHQVRDRRGKEIIKGWKRIQKDPVAREAFEDIPTLMARIRDGTFLHGQGWFRLPWLFAKGQTQEWNVLKILDGNYERNETTNKRDPARVRSSPDSHELFK